MHYLKHKNSLMALPVVSALGLSDLTAVEQLEEAVVTACKRAETLHDMPMAVSVGYEV